jgi:DGQHR domain-containing protein
MAKKASKKTTNRTPRKYTIPCTKLTQGNHAMYLFPISAKKLWTLVQIDRRQEDKDIGYQRALSESRVNKIAKYLDGGHAIPGAILISFDKAEETDDGSSLLIRNEFDAGWVIDGQHRLAGAHKASVDVEVPVVALLGLSLTEQIDFFITINREQKGVPASLYYDLLKHLPKTKTEAEAIQERSADLANTLRKDPDSPFHQRIVVTTSPKQGNLSLTNVVRKLTPHLKREGRLAQFNDEVRAAILNNIYRALEQTFPREYQRPDTVFFRTIGFGAMMNSLPVIIDTTIRLAGAIDFRVPAIKDTLKLLGSFDFKGWREMGTGTAAEKQASDDLTETLSEEADAVASKQIRY